jgi:hypothetical protein
LGIASPARIRLIHSMTSSAFLMPDGSMFRRRQNHLGCFLPTLVTGPHFSRLLRHNDHSTCTSLAISWAGTE